MRTGVDALSFGLSTLNMAPDVFGDYFGFSDYKQQASNEPCSHCGHCGQSSSTQPISNKHLKRPRRGNNYSQYVRKFSLGNGPADLVQDYTVGKESGKMLGTLVALAVARMRNLETFIWDMPTGISREVWIALSSLADRLDGLPCRLKHFSIRWHDNRQLDAGTTNNQRAGGASNGGAASQQPTNSNPAPNLSGAHQHASDNSYDRVESPTFSILPPLKSLRVLEIDEVAYLDEMSVLIGRSKHCLRDLRVGIASHVMSQDWVASWEGEGAEDVVSSQRNVSRRTTTSVKRKGGVLGTLFSSVADPEEDEAAGSLCDKFAGTTLHPAHNEVALPHRPSQPVGPHVRKQEKTQTARFVEQLPALGRESVSSNDGTSTDPSSKPTMHGALQPATPESRPRQTLPIEVLELERVPLSINVLTNSLDLTKLTSLTLLDCDHADQVWKLLRQKFTPQATKASFFAPPSKSNTCPRSWRTEYQLNLKNVFVNAVSPSLLTFLKETLAPNSLEVLFLQWGHNYTSHVTVDQIVRGPLRRHSSSLKKLSIDSSDRPDGDLVPDSSR